MATVTPDLVQYAADPMAFFQDVFLVPGGVQFSDIMADFQRDFLIQVAPCLLAIARRQRPPQRGLWAEMVKGAGKDTLAALSILWLLLFAPWNVLIQCGADDQKQAGELRRSALDWIKANAWIADRIEVQAYSILNTVTGAVAEILTSDASSSHGSRPDLLVLNEVSHITGEPFAQTLLDNFTKMPDAFGLLCTNAGELMTWQWRWRELYRNDPRWYFVKVTQTPAWQTPEDIEEARRRNPPARFRRLYRGEWVTPGGDALPPDSIERSIVHQGPLLERNKQNHLICGLGIDGAVSGHHASIVVLAGSHREQKLRIARVIDFPPPVSLTMLAMK